MEFRPVDGAGRTKNLSVEKHLYYYLELTIDIVRINGISPLTFSSTIALETDDKKKVIRTMTTLIMMNICEQLFSVSLHHNHSHSKWRLKAIRSVVSFFFLASAQGGHYNATSQGKLVFWSSAAFVWLGIDPYFPVFTSDLSIQLKGILTSDLPLTHSENRSIFSAIEKVKRPFCRSRKIKKRRVFFLFLRKLSSVGLMDIWRQFPRITTILQIK